MPIEGEESPKKGGWRALEARERVLGKEHPQTLASVNNLAFLYFKQRDWTRAAQFWREVNSDATVKLITGAIGRLAADKSMGRAEAMRGSMLALIDKGEPREAHPGYWAPFVLVGEGGTASR